MRSDRDVAGGDHGPDDADLVDGERDSVTPNASGGDGVDLPLDPDGGATPCAYTDYVRRPGVDAEDLPATGEDATDLERDIWEALYGVEDPEMPVSIVDLGLIYGLELENRPNGGGAGDGDASVGRDGSEGETGRRDTDATVLMTLTYTGCPARDMLLGEVEAAVSSVDGVDAADVELVWSPEWSLEMVTERGKADLREFGLSV